MSITTQRLEFLKNFVSSEFEKYKQNPLAEYDLFWKFDLIIAYQVALLDELTEIVNNSTDINNMLHSSVKEKIKTVQHTVLTDEEKQLFELFKNDLYTKHNVKRYTLIDFKEKISNFFKSEKNINFDSFEVYDQIELLAEESMLQDSQLIHRLGINKLQFNRLYQEGYFYK